MRTSNESPSIDWRALRLVCTALASALLLGAGALGAEPACAGDASLGAVDFSVRVAPSGGEPQPAREVTFYLLRKSFADIRSEADASVPRNDMNAFIDKLEVSPELKAWMKKHQTVELSGEDFPKKITPDDVLNIKEFADAFSKRYAGDRTVEMPSTKYLNIDRQKHPDKYQQALEQYHEQLRRLIASRPELLDSLYVPLEEDGINPGPRWSKMESERAAHVHRRALELAGTEYLAGQVTTDLDGRGRFSELPAGNYWITSLETQVTSGDAHVRWDFPVRVAAGQTASVQLNNLNGITPEQP
jgi:hypothetical protein